MDGCGLLCTFIKKHLSLVDMQTKVSCVAKKDFFSMLGASIVLWWLDSRSVYAHTFISLTVLTMHVMPPEF